MKKIVILLFAVLVQAVYVFGEELAREIERVCAKGGVVVLPDASHAWIKTAFEKRIAEIRGTANMSVPEGAECRYLSGKGDDAADGKTPVTAWRTTERLEKESLAPGSFVLFERGGVYRGGFRASKGVTYTAYGKGAKPRIYSSPENGADPAKWERTDATNVWRYKIGANDVGTIVFDGGEAHAIKIIPVYNDDGTYTQQYGGRPFNNGYKDLACDLHFWHDYSEKTDFKPFSKGTGYLYLYSAKNPGERFKSIEFNVKKHGVAVGGANDVHIDNLCIMYVGSHGVGASTVKGLRVTNCEFGWIGGSIQSERLFGRKWAVRYGNAVEIWGGCDGFTVDNCYVHDVYDAGLTQQINVEKPDEARDQRHVRYSRNVIENCNYSIEYFLSLKGEARVSNPSRMEDFVIEGNLMRNAGKGFCRQRPDHSQAAHIKSWRNGANRATGYVIRDNVFAFGDEMLVEISSGLSSPDGSDSMPEMKGNVFIGREGQRFGVLNQGKPVELKYDRKLASALGARYSGNLFAMVSAETGLYAIGHRSRESIVTFFTDSVFGRRPAEADHPPLLRFEKTSEDKVMPGGKMVRKEVRIVYGGSCGTNSFPVVAFVPADAKGPVPAFLLICNRDYKKNCDPERREKSPFFPVEDIVARGFAAVSFHTWAVAPDCNTGNTKGVFEAFEKPEKNRDPKLWGTISAWAWGASRALDWMETVPEIDAKRVAVIGHSRGGKTALWAAVTDPRFAMACVNGSGCTGAKLNHMDLPKAERVVHIVRTFQYWFCLDYTLWANREKEMSFDQHELLSCVAPRLLAVGSGSKDDWAGPAGEQKATELARAAWSDPERVSYHCHKGGHGMGADDWNVYLSHAEKYLKQD